MRRAIFRLLSLTGILGFGTPALAGGSSNTWSVTWSPVEGVVEGVAVPTISEWQLAMLGLLLLAIGARMLRRHSAVASLMLTGGLGCAAITGGLLYSDKPTAGASPGFILGASSCAGSETYEVGQDPPPCFKNTCGSPITVDVQFVEGYVNGNPYTFEECDVVPNYCEGETLTDVIPSGETLYNLPYCDNFPSLTTSG